MKIHTNCWIGIFNKLSFSELTQKRRLSNSTITDQNNSELVKIFWLEAGRICTPLATHVLIVPIYNTSIARTRKLSNHLHLRCVLLASTFQFRSGKFCNEKQDIVINCLFCWAKLGHLPAKVPSQRITFLSQQRCTKYKR